MLFQELKELSKEWKNWNDNRLPAVDQIVMIATFLAGFAIADLSGFEPEKFVWYWGEVYVGLMSNVVGCTLFIAVTGVLARATISRVINWDVGFARFIQESSSEDEVKTKVESTLDFKCVIGMLNAIKKTNSPMYDWNNTLGNCDKLGKLSPRQFAHIITEEMADKKSSPIGFARSVFPWTVVMYMAAICVKVLQYVPDKPGICVAPVVLVVWGFPLTYYSYYLLKPMAI